MSELCKSIVQSYFFQNFIIAMILLAAVLVGLETYPSVTRQYGGLLEWLNNLVLWIFALEAVLKMARHGRHFYRYFLDPWNVFDFIIVVVCFLPVNSSYAAVLRLARIMRVMRLMTALPSLQLIVGALLKSIPSMGYVGILLALNFYIYAVLGVFLFGANDPVHFQDLQSAMLSLFRVVTLEDWTDLMYINMYSSANYPGPTLEAYQAANNTGVLPDPDQSPGPLIGAAYFVSFVMFGTMIMLNLFIGVILNSMDEARAERELMAHEERQQNQWQHKPSIDEEIHALEQQIDQLKTGLLSLRQHLAERSDKNYNL